MTVAFNIIVDRKGGVELRKTENFGVPAGSVATRIVLDIPDECFEPVPIATVRFNIPANALRRTTEVDGSLDVEPQ